MDKYHRWVCRFMNIAVSNDDGYSFPGLLVLEKNLRHLGRSVIVAPETDVTGTSQAITLSGKLTITRRSNNLYSVSGYTSDCIGILLHSKEFRKQINMPNIDLFISGINKGVNMGSDVWYSGTVGGARHAFIHGYNAIAISCGYEKHNDPYEPIATFIANFVENILPKLKEPFLLNINHPANTEIQGWQWTKLGERSYKDIYLKETAKQEGNVCEYRFSGSLLQDNTIEETDFHAYSNGYASVTPLKVDTTNHKQLAQWQVIK